jgi:hypothetical protein
VAVARGNALPKPSSGIFTAHASRLPERSTSSHDAREVGASQYLQHGTALCSFLVGCDL